MLMAGSSGATWWLTTRASQSQIPPSMRTSSQFRRFVSTYELIRRQSIWKNSPQQLLLGATNGMVNTLHDQFSDYLTGGQTANLNAMLDPTYVGIGIEVSFKASLVIQAVFPGTPAAKAGLKAGQQIVAINGHATHGMAPQAAMDLLHGRAGSQVTLTIRHGTGTRRFTLTRRTIAFPTVSSTMLPGGIAYLDISEFGQDTGSQVQAAWHQLLAHHPRGLVLDLRGKPGGELTQALRVADLWVPKGPVVTLKYKNQKRDETLDSTGPGTRLPIVVLVNGNTASAAEILSAAIQERQGGELVGTKTYGKGIVQEVIPLSGGASLKLTVARYYTPDGDYIEHKGLTPNVLVKEPAAIAPSDVPSQDPQLRAAIRVLEQRIAKDSGSR
ncbi:S41 family peptidase [Sulfobacillus sp. DSM 109850]|uniref:S41 family peptidase n=2 Tax=Sulfobacillus harzensis TaxID=2729629 RepID=A0A7Y0L3P9_9FIRM|nr:S41 family peptidase [Sulfobacillus harzensis]